MLTKSKMKKTYKVAFLGLIVLTAIWTVGCLEEQWEEPEITHTEVPCDATFDETWRCNGEVIELCRAGYWRPWEDCANIPGGTCETDENSGDLYCYAPPPPDTDTETDTE